MAGRTRKKASTRSTIEYLCTYSIDTVVDHVAVHFLANRLSKKGLVLSVVHEVRDGV